MYAHDLLKTYTSDFSHWRHPAIGVKSDVEKNPVNMNSVDYLCLTNMFEGLAKTDLKPLMIYYVDYLSRSFVCHVGNLFYVRVECVDYFHESHRFFV